MTIPPTPNQLPTNPQSSAEQIPASVRSAPVLGGHDISTSENLQVLQHRNASFSPNCFVLQWV